jgi:hypothetical protein
MTETQKKPWNTGFKPGRPRIGELRLVSPHAAKLQKWRDSNREKYREYQREYQAAWRAKNLERSNELSRASNKRAAERSKNKLAILAITKV